MTTSAASSISLGHIFDHLLSLLSPADLRRGLGVPESFTWPDNLRAAGFLQLLADRDVFGKDVSADQIYDKVLDSANMMVARLPGSILDRLLRADGPAPVARRRLCHVHGAVKEGEYPNLVQAINLGWDETSIGNARAGWLKRLTPEETADLFAGRPLEARAYQLATGSLHIAADLPMAAPEFGVWPNPRWLSEMPIRWRSRLNKLARWTPYPTVFDIDWEFKAWNLHECRQKGSEWIQQVVFDDPRWLPIQERMQLDKSDLATVMRWNDADPRYWRWNHVMKERVIQECQSLLHQAMVEAFPGAVGGSANAWMQAGDLYRITRMKQSFGTGATLGGYSSVKIYTPADLECMRGAVAVDRRRGKGLRLGGCKAWFQDSAALNQWSWTDEGCEHARHAILLCGSHSPVLSVDKGVPRPSTLDTLSKLLQEVDDTCEGIVGEPLVPARQVHGWPLVTTVDCGSFRVSRVTHADGTGEWVRD
jgi:hypothetical protein